MNTVFPEPTPRIVHGLPRQSKVWASVKVGFVIVAALAITSLTANSYRYLPFPTEWILAVLAVPFMVWALMGRRKHIGVIGFLATISSIAVWAGTSYHPLAAAALTLVYASVQISKTYSNEVNLDKKWVELPRPVEFGAPGVHAGFKYDSPEHGLTHAYIEVKTSELLREIAGIPGVVLYHGLESPGSQKVDIEHAVLYGNRLFLIESIIAPSGECSLHVGLNGSITVRSQNEAYKSRMQAALEEFQQAFGAKGSVDGIILLNGEGVLIDPKMNTVRIPRPNPSQVEGVTSTPHDAMVRIATGYWLLHLLGETISPQATTNPTWPNDDMATLVERHVR